MKTKKVNSLFEKVEDGVYEARIEEIGRGHKSFKFLNINFKETPDILMISNRKSGAWVFSIFTGYAQLGKYQVNRPHNYQEGQDILVEINNKHIMNVMEERK